jgi:hypothetical protein
MPSYARYGIAMLVPLVLSFIITFQDRVTAAAFKEQLVTLVALGTGFLALTPRDGNIPAGVRRRPSRHGVDLRSQ